MHHARMFALPGGEPPLLPLTLSTGFGCVQLEQLFKPLGTFSPPPPPPFHTPRPHFSPQHTYWKEGHPLDGP